MLEDTLWNPPLAGEIWIQRLPALFLIIPVWMGLAGWAQVIEQLFLSRMDLRLRPPFACSAVLCLFSCYSFGLAINGVLYSWAAGAFFLPFMLQGFAEIQSFIRKIKMSPVNPWFIGGGVLVLLVWAAEFLSPPLIWDAVLDHFRFAGEVARQHLIPYHWTNHTGDMPKFAEITWAGFWVMGGEFMSKASLAISAGLTLWILKAYANYKGYFGWIGPLLFLTCPVFLALFAWGYVEGHLALFELLALIAFLEFMEGKTPGPWLGLTAFFLGAALATKYTALWMFPGFLVLGLFSMKEKRKKLPIWTGLILFAFCSLPWYLRNELANGNPLYPLFTNLLGGPPGFDRGMENALWADTGREEGLNLISGFALHAKAFFTVHNGIGACWTPLAGMALPWLFTNTKEKTIQRMAVFCVIYFGVWGIFCTNLRHASGGCLILLMMGSFLWEKTLESPKKRAGFLFIPALIFSFLLTFWAQIQTTAPYAAALGMEDPLFRLKRNYSFEMSTYSAYKAIEQNSDTQDRVLAFGVYQTYPLRRTAYVDFFWKKPILLKWAEQAKTDDDLARKLREEGIEFILYQREEAVMMSRKEKDFILTGMPEDQYVEFWRRYADPVGSFGNCTLYQIRKSPSAKIFPLKELPGLQENLLWDKEHHATNSPLDLK